MSHEARQVSFSLIATSNSEVTSALRVSQSNEFRERQDVNTPDSSSIMS